MGIFKDFKDMAAMAKAAPDLIMSSQQLAENAKAQAAAAEQQQGAAGGGFGMPAPTPIDPANLEPIAGVDLEKYVAVTKGIAAYNYDAAHLPTVAAGLGIGAAEWAQAQTGWAARIMADRTGVGARYNQLYTAV